MKKRKILAAALALLILLQLFAGCAALRYDAKLYSYANGWIDEAFLDENRVKGAFYLAKATWYGEADWQRDEESPSARTFIITSEEEYTEIFTNSPPSIDFEKRMAILYVFADCSPRDYRLKGMKVDGSVLTVKVKLENRWGNDATMPYARCFLLVMKKMEITEVVFEEK